MSEPTIPTHAALSAWLSLGGAPADGPALLQLCARAAADGLMFAGARGQGAAGPVLRFADDQRVVELSGATLRALSAEAAAGRPIDWASFALPEGAGPARAGFEVVE